MNIKELIISSFISTAVQIVKAMKDKECSESENVTFDVEVSHPGIDAYWTFKGQPLKAGPQYKMDSKNKNHSLTVMNAMKDEEGEYMFAAGEKTCSALLTVTGKLGHVFFNKYKIYQSLLSAN